MGTEDAVSRVRSFLILGDVGAVRIAANEAIDSGVSARAVIDQALVPAMEEVGRLFVSDEIFLPEMMQAANAFEAAMALLGPALEASGQAVTERGTVVLGTVRGDIHSIGKNIVGLLLRIAGFTVHDLGVDVPPFEFVAKAEEFNADIIACSALLTTTLSGQKDVVEVLMGNGKRDRFKVMVGGGATTARWAEEIGARRFCHDCLPGCRDGQAALLLAGLRAVGRSSMSLMSSDETSCAKQRMNVLDLFARAEDGPLMTQDDFVTARLVPALKSVVSEFEVTWDHEAFVSSDDDLADRVFAAAVELMSQVGFYCPDTNRVMEFTRAEDSRVGGKRPSVNDIWRRERPPDHATSTSRQQPASMGSCWRRYERLGRDCVPSHRRGNGIDSGGRFNRSAISAHG